jgi:TIR domain
MAIDVEKLMLLRELGASLAEKELTDINLLLHELGLTEIAYNPWYGDGDEWEPGPADRALVVIDRIRDLPRAEVDELAIAVSRLYDVDLSTRAKETAVPLVLFASHLSTHRDLVGAVGNALSHLGITLFVAHDSIEPDLEWQQEIERFLSTCHAGVAFLWPGFTESMWCDQEIGWLLGRGVPCFALKFQGQDPYGLLGKKQAKSVPDFMTADQVAEAIISWLETKPQLATHFQASLVEALKVSANFRTTDQIWAGLQNAEGMQPAQVAGLLVAIRDNDQVFNASGGARGPYKELLLKLALRQPGFEANTVLAREVASIRNLESILLDADITTADQDPWSTA